MSRERVLARAFVDLADTLVTDYDMIDLLYRLADVCVQLLEVDAAGLLLWDQHGHLVPMAASTEQTRLLELFELQSNEGPCLECINTGVPVTVTNLERATQRWPQFAPAAAAAGFSSVHALPMRLRTDVIGALNLYATRPGPIAAEDLGLAQGLADVATIGILSERAIHRNAVLSEQLQGALNSRTVIEQAKGLIVGRSGLQMSQAFTLLRTHARSHNLKLAELAHRLVLGQIDIDALRGLPGEPVQPGS